MPPPPPDGVILRPPSSARVKVTGTHLSSNGWVGMRGECAARDGQVVP